MNVNVAPVDITTLQERVYRSLREALAQGRLTAGEQMTIRALAAALGTSEMPVREALKRLLAERVLVQAPNRTFQIVPMTAPRLRELTQIRIVVEGMAARLAAEAGGPALTANLERLNRGMQAALERGDPAQTLRANQEFHFAIYRAANSPQLLEIIELLWLRAGPYLAASFGAPRDPAEMFRRAGKIHARLLKAIARRNGEAAQQALALDLTRAAEWCIANGVVAAGEPASTRSRRPQAVIGAR
jgi:DNA-binding GntR family transcriptional regulator